MALSEEEIQTVKDQLRSQIQNLPEDKKAEAESQIAQMSPEALETLVQQQQQNPPIYRHIIEKQIQAIVVGENPSSLAVLDNKPISKGHTVIIPKEAAKTPQQIPKEAFTLAQELTDKIIKNLKAKEAKAHTETKFGETIINLIPIYDKPLDINSPRTETTPEQLEEIKKSFNTIVISKKPEKIKIAKRPPAKPIKLKRRIP